MEMKIVNVCEALDISFHDYYNLPNWYIDLRLAKLNARLGEEARQNNKKF